MKIKSTLARMITAFVCAASLTQSAGAITPLNNSDVTPRLLPDNEVKMEGVSPDWVKTLIMAEVRLETATPQGTLKSSVALLDHYAEMGVNGLWVTPVYGRNGHRSIGYGNRGPNTFQSDLTGSDNPQQSLAALREFVSEAHRRNIRILFDIVVWGVGSDSPLVKTNPGFFKPHKDPSDFKYNFNWESKGLRQWFKNAAVNLIEQTGADGFRVDLAPDVSGYYFKEIRDELYARGRKIMIMSEMPSKNRSAFDCEENGVTGWTEPNDFSKGYESYTRQFKKFGCHNTYFFHHDILDAVRTGVGIGHADLQRAGRGGMFRFYTSCVLNHDDYRPFAMGNPVRFAYSTIFAPYIPLWWIGEEWNNPDGRRPPTPADKKDPGSYVMYTNPINWNWNPRQVVFYETIKQYIRIRRENPLIFNHFAGIARNANIASVNATKVGAPNRLPAYARFAAGKAIIIVPNYEDPQVRVFNVSASLQELHLNPGIQYQLRVLNSPLEDGFAQGQGVDPDFRQNQANVAFTVQIKPNHIGVYAVEPLRRQR